MESALHPGRRPARLAYKLGPRPVRRYKAGHPRLPRRPTSPSSTGLADRQGWRRCGGSTVAPSRTAQASTAAIGARTTSASMRQAATDARPPAPSVGWKAATVCTLRAGLARHLHVDRPGAGRRVAGRGGVARESLREVREAVSARQPTLEKEPEAGWRQVGSWYRGGGRACAERSPWTLRWRRCWPGRHSEATNVIRYSGATHRQSARPGGAGDAAVEVVTTARGRLARGAGGEMTGNGIAGHERLERLRGADRGRTAAGWVMVPLGCIP